MKPVTFEYAMSAAARALLIAALLAAAYALSLTLAYPDGGTAFIRYADVPAICENALATACVALGGILLSRAIILREEMTKR